VGENVPGLLSSNNGDFFGGTLSDLAALGYFVGWCTYGAVDVGAWHRRDRIFIVAYSPLWQDNRRERGNMDTSTTAGQSINASAVTGSQDATDTTESGLERTIAKGSAQAGGLPTECGNVPNAVKFNGNSTGYGASKIPQFSTSGIPESGWQFEPRMGNVVDGLPSWLAEPDGVPRVATGIKARVAKLKALGNAVVPAQIYPIYKAIVEIDSLMTTASGEVV